MPLDELKKVPYGELYNNKESKQLVEWINGNLNQNEAILSDMPTSSIIRCATRNRVVINPQYEDYDIRKKTRFLYTLGDYADDKWFGEEMYQIYKCEYVVVPKKFCLIPNDETDAINKLLKSNDYTKYSQTAEHGDRLCNRLLMKTSTFDLLFSNGHYFIYKYNKDRVSRNDKLGTTNSFEAIKPWLSRCSSDPKCPQQIYSTFSFLNEHVNSQLAREILEYGIKTYSENLLMIRLYAEAMDYDLERYSVANKYYRKLIYKMGDECKSREDFLLLSQYLGFLLETKEGNHKEIKSIVELSSKCLDLQYKGEDSESLCLFSAQLLEISRTFKDQMTRPLAQKFWQKGLEYGRQNECFYKHYSKFNQNPPRKRDLFANFLFGKFQVP
ncbi:hypothetical protein BEWA_022650 [Theileria equi strain WA]|uniref:Uncharacterized protein n=1 Tax=Theileria equi strain WA TaxID=1537102 RepID=L0AUZ6_THEEQ|nr:hypothetical protein BEWA_022650 [Theileria equi strain WA]AFZ79417.1 hypothetical protein BEWA_022650 [Theileria equi strain WA]|eukprot:XP_004829083.1 hypothetical protein BEWA_022650 [Theileria equi strain WA]